MRKPTIFSFFSLALVALFENVPVCDFQAFPSPAFVTIGKSDLFYVCFNSCEIIFL